MCVCVYFYMHPVGNELLPLSLSGSFLPILGLFLFYFIFSGPPPLDMFVVDMHVYALR